MASSFLPRYRDLWSGFIPARTPGPLGHNDAADPNILAADMGDTPGSLGVNDHGAGPPTGRVGGGAISHEPYLTAHVQGKRPPRFHRRLPPVTPKTSNELNLFGIFTTIWKDAADSEIIKETDRRSDKWFPATKELLEFARSNGGDRSPEAVPMPVINVWQVLCKIAERKPKRVNIFSHGAFDGSVGLSGNVIIGDVNFSNPEETFIDPGLIADNSDSIPCSDKKTISLQDVKSAFPAGAELFLYACKGGSKPELLQKLADTLGIRIHGFVHDILFIPTVSSDRKTITGWQWKESGPPVPGAPPNPVSDFHKLKPSIDKDPATIPKSGPPLLLPLRRRQCEVGDWY